jgi:hypothetical protein
LLSVRDPEELLATVKAEGLRRRRRRHLRWQIGGGLLAVALAVPVAAALFDDDPAQVQVASDADDRSDRTTRTTVVRRATTTTAPAVTTTVAPATETTAVAAPTTTAAPLVCHNSTNKACGPFYWDPAPGNAALDMSISGPTTVPTGTLVTFTVQWSDADAQLSDYSFSGGLDPLLLPNGCDASATQPAGAYGPWDPPATDPGSGSFSESRTYDQPGTYTVEVYALSRASGSCPDPYESYGHATLTITVV